MELTEKEIIDLELNIEDVMMCEEIFYKDKLPITKNDNGEGKK